MYVDVRFNREYDHTLSRIYATFGVVRSSERCFINLQFRLEFHVKQDIKQTPHEFQVYAMVGYAILCEIYTSPASLYWQLLIHQSRNDRLFFPSMQSLFKLFNIKKRNSIKINIFNFHTYNININFCMYCVFKYKNSEVNLCISL